MAKGALTVGVRIDGVNQTLAAFRQLPKDANDALREAAQDLARRLALSAQRAASADNSPQSDLIAPTVKAGRDRLPLVQAGGSKRVGRHRAPAWKLLFGSEFGSNRYKQFGHPHAGKKGYWLFPTVEREQSAIAAAWRRAADDIVRQWEGRNG